MPNLNTLQSLEPLEKVPGGGGWGVGIESNFRVQLKLKPKLSN